MQVMCFSYVPCIYFIAQKALQQPLDCMEALKPHWELLAEMPTHLPDVCPRSRTYGQEDKHPPQPYLCNLGSRNPLCQINLVPYSQKSSSTVNNGVSYSIIAGFSNVGGFKRVYEVGKHLRTLSFKMWDMLVD